MDGIKIEKEYVDGCCVFMVEGRLDTNTSSYAGNIFMDEFETCKNFVINMEKI